MKIRRTSTTLVLALVALAGGCQGHGKYTGDHLNAATARMNDLKSANEFQMAEQAFLSGDLDKAFTKIEAALAMNDTVARSHVLRGRILAERNILADALASFQRAAELEPGNVDAQYYQGVINERVQNPELALAQYLKACEMAPTNPQFALAAAETMIDMGKSEDAVAFLRERDQTFRLDSGIQQLLGHMAMMAGDHTEAVARFNQSRILAPDDQSATEDLVHALMEVKNYAEADFYLAGMLRKVENEKRRDLMHLRVQCLQRLDRPVDARDLLVKLTADGSNDVEAWIALGHVSLQLKDLGRVREAGNRVVGLAPYRSDGHILRAMWQRRMGDFTGALTSLDAALEAAPNDTSIRVMQALVLVDAGRTDLAIRELQIAQRIDPGNQMVDSTLAGLMRQAAHPEN